MWYQSSGFRQNSAYVVNSITESLSFELEFLLLCFGSFEFWNVHFGSKVHSCLPYSCLLILEYPITPLRMISIITQRSRQSSNNLYWGETPLQSVLIHRRFKCRERELLKLAFCILGLRCCYLMLFPNSTSGNRMSICFRNLHRSCLGSHG